MAKSLRSKREKRLKAIRREIVKPLYDKKDEAKLAAQEAALAAPKLPVRVHKSAMELIEPDSAAAATTSSTGGNMDVEMAEDGQIRQSLKPVSKIGKRMRKKIKMAKRNYRGKGKIRKKHNV
ncbi:hypothetical protein Vadar_032183 [Vaccinium darrowii]|uniref:Uncharacterized protein n=1 Tax=Vaccinium darrowii TaxID=229202 RepID=A0ACB7XDR1_9ERIC|nr:hypothetical protein Vadar_032183 [Vaccinium darrowii]